MLLVSSVNTPIDNNRTHLLALRMRVLCELGLTKAFWHARTLEGNPQIVRVKTALSNFRWMSHDEEPR